MTTPSVLFRRTITIIAFLTVTAPLVILPAVAQQSGADRGDRGYLSAERSGVRLSEQPPGAQKARQHQKQRGGSRAEAARRQSAPNLFMQAAAGLTGTADGSTSIADADGDGNLDLLITGADAEGNPTATLYLGDGQGGFTEADAGLTSVSGGSTSIADVNGDETTDLLIVGDNEFGTETTMLYLGDGQGGFSKADAGLIRVGRGPSTSIADVDGDGNQDLLITGRGATSNVSEAILYLGDGQGGFTEAGAGLTGVRNGTSTSIADVDGDGNKDLLITGDGDPNRDGSLEATSILYLGDGQGGFSDANAGLTGVVDGSTSIADVNGDDNQDLLITGTPEESFDPTAILYLGDGQGSFTEANASLTGVSFSSTSIADVDGDGNKDLLITGEDANSDPTATLYLGDGDGGFSETDAGLSGTQFGSTSIADLYGDGDQDLLITGEEAPFGEPSARKSSARVYVNRQAQSPPNHAPTFASTFSYDHPLAPGVPLRRTVEAGDVDGDSIDFAPNSSNVSINDNRNGVAEVVFTPARTQGRGVANPSVQVSDPSGASQSFSTSVEIPGVVAAFSADLSGLQLGSTSIADVDGDGHQDLLITGADENFDPMATLYLRDGRGGFTKPDAGLTSVSRSSTSIADVDGDGNKDLLITGRDANRDPTAILYLGDGQGGFTEANAGLTGVEESSTSIADVDGDGHQDLLITGRDENFDATATLYLGDGQGGFTEANAGLTSVFRGSISIADVDGDGNKDLLITGRDANRDPTAILYLGDGQGGFTEAGANLAKVKKSSTSIADVNGDDNQDLLISGEDDRDNTMTKLFLGDGQGGFSEANAGLTGVDWGSTSIADVDGDGNQDLLITGRTAIGNATAILYLGDGQGGFTEASAGLANVKFSSISIADIGGDMDPDFLVTGESSTSRSPLTILYENLFDNPIPVELTSFDATVDQSKVRLTWQTASEQNNTGFRVQRRETESVGKGTWTTVGSVDGAGTTSEPQSYRFTDEDLPYEADRLTYRLKQVDTDGTTHVSKEVTVRRGVQRLQLEAPYPNPARGPITVRYAVPERQEVTLQLYDVLGRTVRTVGQGPREGRHELRISASSLSSGVYFLRLSAGGETRTRRMTVVQ